MSEELQARRDAARTLIAGHDTGDVDVVEVETHRSHFHIVVKNCIGNEVADFGLHAVRGAIKGGGKQRAELFRVAADPAIGLEASWAREEAQAAELVVGREREAGLREALRVIQGLPGLLEEVADRLDGENLPYARTIRQLRTAAEATDTVMVIAGLKNPA